MKGKLTKTLSSLMLVTLISACSSPHAFDLDDYVSTLEYKDGFSICVLEDIHLSTQSNLDREFKYLQEVIYSRHYVDKDNFETLESARPDVIVLNGDTFQVSNKTLVNKFFDFMDGLNIPFLFNYGNHDLQGQYSNQYINRRLAKCTNCISKNPNDLLYGDQNTVTNIKDGDSIKWQLYTLDSNTYYGFNYDIVHEDQVEWYENQLNKAKNDNNGNLPPSLMFFHVPTEEFLDAWVKAGGKEVTHGDGWYMGESVSSGYSDSDIYEKCQEYGSTKGIFVAHDHVNNTDWHYNIPSINDNVVRLVFGTKTGEGIYHDKDIMGAMFITLDRDENDVHSIDENSFAMTRVTHTYDDKYFVVTDEFLANFNGGERA